MSIKINPLELLIKENYINRMTLQLETVNRYKVTRNWGAIKHEPVLDKIYYIKEGYLSMSIDDVLHEVGPGTVLFIPGGTVQTFHLLDETKEMDHYYCHFTSFIEGQGNLRLSQVLKFPYAIDTGMDTTFDKLFDNLRAVFNKEDLVSGLESKSILLQMIIHYLKQCGQLDIIKMTPTLSLIPDVLTYIEENLHRKLTNEELADVIHLHPNYFNSVFKKYVGETPLRYINHLRIKQAKDLLLRSSEAISEIPELVGFKDIYYFSKAFKKATGMSPSLYRSLHQSHDSQVVNKH